MGGGVVGIHGMKLYSDFVEDRLKPYSKLTVWDPMKLSKYTVCPRKVCITKPVFVCRYSNYPKLEGLYLCFTNICNLKVIKVFPARN